MVSRITALSLLALLALCAGVVAGCGGLGVSSASAFAAGDDNGPASADDAGGTPGPFGGGSDAGAVTATPPGVFISNPLCAAKISGTCDPQRGNVDTDAGTATDQCDKLLGTDAGVGPDAHDAAVAPAPRFACHVARNAGGGVAPVCLPEGTTTGTCTSSAQCMAGHECVGDGANVDAQCRRYCCEANACDVTSFCDVQPIVGTTKTMVPVCMQLAPCELLSLNPTQCPSQQCGIALDGKELEIKTCLDIGPRGVGEDCETDHCAKDLSCLGAPGARKCFQLCDTSKGSKHTCPMGLVCQSSGTTFKGGSVGICAN